jgi:hypothetical protein
VITEFEVRQNIDRVKREQSFHCFQLRDDAFLDNKVDPVAGFHVNTVMVERSVADGVEPAPQLQSPVLCF